MISNRIISKSNTGLASDHSFNAQNFSAVSLARLSNSGLQQEKSTFSFPPHVGNWDNSLEEVATALIWQLSFQSRIGPKAWLQPYTSETLKTWGGQGTKSVQVLCPGFAIDCLETREEIAHENREYYEQAGGGDYQYIPCLNDSDAHKELMLALIDHHTENW